MPMGPSPLGFAYFVGVKFAGYTAAAWVLRKFYPDSQRSPVKAGAVRTAIGIGAGFIYGGIWLAFANWTNNHDPSTVLYFLGLIPVRIIEWMWLIHLFYDRGLKDRVKALKASAAGTAWSYCLDAIGIGAAFVIPGGIWVC